MTRLIHLIKRSAVLAAILSLLPIAAVWAASYPQPTYGTANVDGSDSEWVSSDFFYYTYWTQDHSRKKAKVYLRYDCDSSTLYVRVKGYDTGYYIDADAGDINYHFVYIDGALAVQGDYGDDNSVPDFSYYGYNSTYHIANGWEASINVSPGSHTIQVGTRVYISGGPENLDSLTNPSSPFYISLDLTCTEYDFGDLPSNYSYVTLSEGTGGGARHQIGDLYLGTQIDAESDGQHDANALGDDNHGVDDEDGVVPTPGVDWQPNTTDGGSVDVYVTGGDGCLDGWIDWNSTGVFYTPAGEYVIQSVLVHPGVNTITFDIPSVNLDGGFFARFRLYPTNAQGTCDGVGGSPTGEATNGEVEDYVFDPGTPTAVTVTSLTAHATANGLPLFLAVGGLGILAGLAVVLRRRQ
jgi:GEVED domain